MKFRIARFVLFVVVIFSFFGYYYNGMLKEILPGEDDAILKFHDVKIFSVDDDPWVVQLMEKMTVEEKIGQLIFPYASARNFSKEGKEYERLKELVQKYKVGGFCLFRGAVEEQVNLINELQSLSAIPLLFSADFENGVTQRIPGGTAFPTMMALGAADDVRLTRRMAEIIAGEAKALGIHQNYAPVSDVNNNPLNPIINTRSFGEDPLLVTRLSDAYIYGLQKGGIIATAKHFPGHGNTNIDSHSSLPVLDLSKKELKAVELKPFSSNIKHGVISVMVGHLGIKSYDKEILYPASLSKNIITGLLRNELKFTGLVVTDALNMYSITKNYSPGEAAVLAFEAGNDCLLFPESDIDTYSALLEAFNSGRISIGRIDQSVKKILIAKRWSGLDKYTPIDLGITKKNIGRAEYHFLARTIAEKSITLVKNNGNIIPVAPAPDKKIFHIALNDNENIGTSQKFSSYLTDRIESIKSFYVPSNYDKKNTPLLLDSLKDAGQILLSVYIRIKDGKGNLNLSSAQDELIKAVIDLKKPVVLLSHGNPYFLSGYPEVDAYICSYGDNTPSERALAQALFGEQEISGKLPVSIPNTGYVSGTSLNIQKSILTHSPQSLKSSQLKQLKKLDQIFKTAIADTAFPGAVLLVVKDGKIVHEKAYGNFTYDKKSPKMEVNTIFDLASVTKVIATTTAAMICVHRGLINLEDKVSKYIPKFASHGKDEVRIKNLLLHNSGLPSFKPFHKKYSTANQVINNIYSTSLEYTTGTKTVYSDLGMITMGKVIEAVSGKSLDKFCNDEIFIPLGMKNTFFNPPKSLVGRIAPTEIDNYWRMRPLQGEVHDEAASLLNGVSGHAGLFSTANDLAVLLQMLLQKGFYQGRQLISKTTVDMFTKQYSDKSNRGLGWGIKTDNSTSAGSLFSTGSYGHTGYTGTSVWTDPLKNIIVVLLTNRVYPTRENNNLSKYRYRIHDEVYRILMK